MGIIPALIIVLVAVGLTAVLIKSAFKKDVSGVKIMLLGINITLLGGIIAIDPDSNLGGFEYFIVIFGLIISIIGLMKKD